MGVATVRDAKAIDVERFLAHCKGLLPETCDSLPCIQHKRVASYLKTLDQDVAELGEDPGLERYKEELSALHSRLAVVKVEMKSVERGQPQVAPSIPSSADVLEPIVPEIESAPAVEVQLNAGSVLRKRNAGPSDTRAELFSSSNGSGKDVNWEAREKAKQEDLIAQISNTTGRLKETVGALSDGVKQSTEIVSELDRQAEKQQKQLDAALDQLTSEMGRLGWCQILSLLVFVFATFFMMIFFIKTINFSLV